MTHAELIEIAGKWLTTSKRCSFVLTELACIATSEIPDCIGFHGGYSFLVECKVSRSDFLADRKKSFRKRPALGMGNFRFFLCPENVVNPEDLPEKWGLIWVTPKGKTRQIVGPKGNIYSSQTEFMQCRNIEAEHGLLVSALRRLNTQS